MYDIFVFLYLKKNMKNHILKILKRKKVINDDNNLIKESAVYTYKYLTNFIIILLI